MGIILGKTFPLKDCLTYQDLSDWSKKKKKKSVVRSIQSHMQPATKQIKLPLDQQFPDVDPYSYQ